MGVNTKQLFYYSLLILAAGIMLIAFYHKDFDTIPWRKPSQIARPDIQQRNDLGEVHTWTHSPFNSSIYSQSDDGDEDNRAELTVVTGYIQLESFKKSAGQRTSEAYEEWMNAFSRVQNPVIAFFDQMRHVTMFRRIRSRLPANLTHVVLVDRAHLWAFGLLPRIREIYSQKGYPRHSPHTVVPEYSCVVHAKYEFMLAAVTANHFRTTYFTWLDFGFFRDLDAREKENAWGPLIRLWIPPLFDATKVSYMEVFPRKVSRRPWNIVRFSAVWVGGGLFLATGSVMETWVWDYKGAVEAMIAHNIMASDEQVLYYLVNHGHPKGNIQTYRSKQDRWYYLGYLCLESGRNRTILAVQ